MADEARVGVTTGRGQKSTHLAELAVNRSGQVFEGNRCYARLQQFEIINRRGNRAVFLRDRFTLLRDAQIPTG